MRSRRRLQRIKALVLVLGVFGVGVQLAQADPFDYKEDFSKFGKQRNNVCGGGVCGAIAAIS